MSGWHGNGSGRVWDDDAMKEVWEGLVSEGETSTLEKNTNLLGAIGAEPWLDMQARLAPCWGTSTSG